MRAFITALSGGFFLDAPIGVGKSARHFNNLTRMCSVFAFIADVGLMTVGGALKRKEHLSGRYADAFAWLFMASAALKRFHDQGAQEPHRALLDWTMAKALYEVEQALIGVLANPPNRLVANIAELIAFPLGTKHAALTDRQMDAVSDAVLAQDGRVRAALTRDIYIPDVDEPGLGELEFTLDEIREAQPIRIKLDKARRNGRITKAPVQSMAEEALQAKIISKEEYNRIIDAEIARNCVVQVDSYDTETFQTLK